jgi:hypothetical protein
MDNIIKKLKTKTIIFIFFNKMDHFILRIQWSIILSNISLKKLSASS